MQLTDSKIREIASNMELGLICAVHKTTLELTEYPDFDSTDMDLEGWEEVYDEMEFNSGAYLHFAPMSSHESYEIMPAFAETVDDEELKAQLFDALDKPKPFSRFKHIVDNSGPYREKWFAFREAQTIEYVKRQLERFNREMEDED